MITFQQYKRFKISGGVRATLTVLFLGAVAAFPQVAHAQAQTAPKFGSVDLGQVLNESKVRQKDTQELTGTVAGLRQVLQRLQESGARFLTEAEIKELDGLYEKKTPTDAEKKRIGQLEDAATLKVATKSRLENTPTPNEEQRKQYGDLTAAEQAGQNTLKGLSDEFSRRVDVRQTELQNKNTTAIKAAIAKVAKDQGLTVVFDSQVAVYTTTDITADVIKEINK